MRVVNVRREKCDTFIGRPSKYGNPFAIGRDGDRAEVIEKYREYIRGRPCLIEDLREEAGETLGCFCAPLPCHGDVLLEELGKGGNHE